ncbi:MAG: DUF4317 domain-containing protein [Clostridia bacterium]|nr:DUF4317 domain-containing protein [Clostridia bacterium]
MNAREISELKRRFSPDNDSLTCIRGCYVSTDKEIVSLFRLPLVALPEEERERYMTLFRKVLSGTPEKNLVPVEFAAEAVGSSDEHKLLSALRNGALEDDELAQVFFQRVIDGLDMQESCLILLAHDVYEVPFRGASVGRDPGEGDEIFTYIACAVCPVKLTKAELVYRAEDNLFHTADSEWAVAAPEFGFVFPAFDGRSANISSALCYTKDPAENHPGLVHAVFGAEPPIPAAEQEASFRGLLQETLAEECSMEVVQSVHERLSEQLAEQKHDREAPPAKVSAREIRQALEVCGVPEERVQAFEERYQEEFGGAASVSTVNAVDPKRFEVRTPNVVIKVDPAHSDLVETRMINGLKYILIRAEEGVEVNGVSVTIQAERY